MSKRSMTVAETQTMTSIDAIVDGYFAMWNEAGAIDERENIVRQR